MFLTEKLPFVAWLYCVLPEGSMATYKVDGAKFKSEQELLDSLWPLYQNRKPTSKQI